MGLSERSSCSAPRDNTGVGHVQSSCSQIHVNPQCNATHRVHEHSLLLLVTLQVARFPNSTQQYSAHFSRASRAQQSPSRLSPEEAGCRDECLPCGMVGLNGSTPAFTWKLPWEW